MLNRNPLLVSESCEGSAIFQNREPPSVREIHKCFSLYLVNRDLYSSNPQPARS